MSVSSSRIEQLDRHFAPLEVSGEVAWYDVLALGLEGRGFTDVLTPYDRLPARAKAQINARVWELSQMSAGMCVRFATEATSLSARWTLRFEEKALVHMPATGVSGLDLYVRTPAGWRWQAVGVPRQTPFNSELLVSEFGSARRREFLLYLPLYNGVTRVEIGVPAQARLEPTPPPRASRPICFYGTSIVQGGCASRPGMAYPAILGRRLDRTVLNLGFSGNGRVEPEMANLLAELDPCVYVIDPLPNLTAVDVEPRLTNLVRTLRAARPHTPIVLVENITYQQGDPLPANVIQSDDSNAALRRVHRTLCDGGVTGLHYLAGAHLLGDDGEATVDGTHPTDVGFLRIAQALRPVLEPLL